MSMLGLAAPNVCAHASRPVRAGRIREIRSEDHTSELQSRLHLVCRLLLEKKKNVGSEPQVRVEPELQLQLITVPLYGRLGAFLRIAGPVMSYPPWGGLLSLLPTALLCLAR